LGAPAKEPPRDVVVFRALAFALVAMLFVVMASAVSG
jgi:hypothetical protein